jgi:hypothetical protein
MPPRTSAGRRQNPRCTTSAKRRNESRERWRTNDLPLAVWPCAQRTGQWQRQGRYLPESNRHPAKMLPEIARRAIDFYSGPGDLVLDPMCGIATTLVEATSGTPAAKALWGRRWCSGTMRGGSPVGSLTTSPAAST